MKFPAFPRLALPAAAVLLAATSTAQAHAGHSETAGFLHGFAHPISGADHLLAMVAVGLWATQLATNNRRALLGVPFAFVGMMLLGAILGASGIALSGVETGILVSVLVLGVLVAAATRLPLAASMALVGVFALFHGHAHGAEMPASSNGLMYGAGLVLATVVLQAVGIGAGVGFKQLLSSPKTLPIRYAGAAIALCGLVLMVS